jgi:hypothetical protein
MKEENQGSKKYRKVEKPLLEFRGLINAIDLDAIDLGIRKVMPYLTPSQLSVLKERYRNFLYLCGSTGEIIVPTAHIDKVWHAHILDTVKYQADCESVFGFFLHHNPYFGLKGDREELDEAFKRTSAIYELEFGEAYEISDAASHDPEFAQKVADDDDRSCG